jgi:hypothetical protein
VKLYREYERASMVVRDDPDIEIALKELQAEHPVDYVIETGTYLGTGSTRIFAEFYQQNRPVRRFVTMEANWDNWRRARSNLKRFSFVEPKWGLSVNKGKAIEFIRNDAAIREHQLYPGIFIDDINDPIGFYTKELESGATRRQGSTPQVFTASALKSTVKELVKRALYWHGEDLLTQILKRHKMDWPLVVLDSAGGIGRLEFEITLETMGSAGYALFLDDTHHLKHFRSLQEIRSRSDFRLIRAANDGSWVLAVHDA